MLLIDPILTLPKEKPKQAEQTFVEVGSANGDTRHIAQVSDCS